MSSVNKTKGRMADKLMMGLVLLSTSLSIILLLGIIIFVFVKGVSTVSLSFLTGVTSVLKGTVGIAGNILNTVLIIVITMLIATPIGIGSAIFLNEYAKKGPFVTVIEYATETLSGIPSIIFGLFGMMFFGNTLGLGYSLLTGGLTLILMVLPLITRNTQEALKSVPDSYRNGAVGLGSGKWHMIRTILIPSAMPGIITGVILAIGRIVGESAALLFTAGSAKILPPDLFGCVKKIIEPGGTLTIQLYLSATKGEFGVAFGIAFVLLVIVLGINFLAKGLAKHFDVRR